MRQFRILIVIKICFILFIPCLSRAETHHLNINCHTASLSPESLSEPMTAIKEKWGPDELDDLRNSINHMQKDLQASFAAQTSLSEKLKRHEKELEETVRRKTASLRKANEKLKLEIAQKEALQAEREKIIEDLEQAFHEVRQLSGMLPICARCKKIRDDSGYWKRLETYITEHSEAVFTHSICPDFAKELYPDLDLEGDPS